MPRAIQERAIRDYWAKVDQELAARSASGLRLDLGIEAAQLSGVRA